MTVTVYRSDDAGAPTLTAADGALVGLLDAVLVNGYGAKAAAGWTKEFSGTNQAIYRNATTAGGTGCFFQIDDSPATMGESSSFQHKSKITGATNMTGFGAHTEPFGAPTNNYLAKSASSVTTETRSWVIVADQHTVVFMSRQDIGANTSAISSADFYTPFYFGDMAKWVAGQVNCSLIAGTHLNGIKESSLVWKTQLQAHKTAEGAYPSPTSDQTKLHLGSQLYFYYAHDSRHAYLRRGKHVINKLRINDLYSRSIGEPRGFNLVRTEDTSSLGSGDVFTVGTQSYLLFRILDEVNDVFCAVETSDTWDSV